MPLQNRVLPTGEIVATPLRGLFTGNRGILHDARGRMGRARWRHKRWICCTLTHPRGHYHGPVPARGWTALFFLDEAVALAAGHRPCHYCRPAAAAAFRAAWTAALGPALGPVAGADAIDAALHAARIDPARGGQRRFQTAAEGLPDGCFLRLEDGPALLLGDAALPFGPQGYGPARPSPRGAVTVLTPAPLVAVLRAGYAPALHPTAAGGDGARG